MRIPSATKRNPARIRTSFKEANTARTTPRPNPAQHKAQQLQSRKCFMFFILLPSAHQIAFIPVYAAAPFWCAPLMAFAWTGGFFPSNVFSRFYRYHKSRDVLNVLRERGLKMLRLQKLICMLILALAVIGAAYSLSIQYTAAQSAPPYAESIWNRTFIDQISGVRVTADSIRRAQGTRLLPLNRHQSWSFSPWLVSAVLWIIYELHWEIS